MPTRAHDLPIALSLVFAVACTDDGATASGAVDDGANGMMTTSTAGDDADTTGSGDDSSSVSAGRDDGGEVSPPMDDEFDDRALTAWTHLREDALEVAVSDGQLHLEPAAQTLWFNDSAAGLLFQRVKGDFMVTADVTARALSSPEPPAVPYRLGGLMVRAPERARESYAFIVLGADANDVSVETKNTIDGQSDFEGPPWPSGAGRLRICRVGTALELLVATREGDWQRRALYERPDLPTVVQVGPVAYANATPADLRVSFDYVRFARVESLADCTR